MSAQGFLPKHPQGNHHREASERFLSLEQEMPRQEWFTREREPTVTKERNAVQALG